MKIQDILFFALLGVILILRKPKLIVLAGLACLLLAIPLFAFHVFFTAERLTWYAAAFFLISLLVPVQNKK